MRYNVHGKYILIHYDRLSQLGNFQNYHDLQINHKKWVAAYLQDETNSRDEKWTRSLAVGSQKFINAIRERMGIAVRGRRRMGDGESFHLRERLIAYGDDFGVENGDIEGQNTYHWD